MDVQYHVCAILALIVGAIIPVILDGVERKLRAALQSRIGPPITQTLYDLLKLTVKESKLVHTVPFILMCITSFILCAFASMYLVSLYALGRDIALLAISVSLLAVSLAAFTLAPLLIPNPFSYIGGIREVMLALVNESFFVASIIVYSIMLNLAEDRAIALYAAALISTIAIMIISGYALTGRPPFDIAEAEPELASGIHIELSGKLLALYLYSNLVKRFLVKVFMAALLVTLTQQYGPPSLLLSYLLVLALWVLFAVVAVVLGRSRVDLAPKTLSKVYIALLAISITGLLVVVYG